MSNNNTNLKRTRSTESLEMAFKRARPFHVTDSPASVSSEPILSTIHHPFSPPTTTTTHQLASTTTQQTSNIVYPTSSSSPTLLETISISTKSATDSNIPPSSPYATYQPPPLPDYSHVNGMLHSLHVQRFGDPESRESWWEQAQQQQQQQEEDQDIDMEETNDEYATANSILRQAFLQRRH